MKSNVKRISFLALALIFMVGLSGCNSNLNQVFSSKKLSPDQAKVKVESYINDNLMAPGSKAQIDSITEENGLYKLAVNIGEGQVIDSYMTKDGSKFFPQALEMNPAGEERNEEDGVASAEIPKNDKPVVELFVMSHCPYGTQIEKGIIPAIEALGDKITFELKFCDYAMHGEKELKEQINQYCIQKEQNDKLFTYLKCFLEAGDSQGCLSKAKVDAKKLSACADKTDKEFKVSANFKDQSTYKGSYPTFDVYKADNSKYGVGGSPTLIINGGEYQGGRDSQSLLAGICGGFNEQPEECRKTVSSATPTPGFGSGTTDSTANGGCE